MDKAYGSGSPEQERINCFRKFLIVSGGAAPGPPEFTHFAYKVMKRIGGKDDRRPLLHRARATAQGRSPALPLSCTRATVLYMNAYRIGRLLFQMPPARARLGPRFQYGGGLSMPG